MEESREKTNTKGPTLVKTKGNAASDIAWRRISARAKNIAEIISKARSDIQRARKANSRYNMHQVHDGKVSSSHTRDRNLG